MYFNLFIVFLMANLCAYMITDIVRKVSQIIKLKKQLKKFERSLDDDYGQSD